MKNLYNGIRKFAQDEEGAAAVEYGIIVGLIAVGIIVATGTLRDAIVDTFTAISDALT